MIDYSTLPAVIIFGFTSFTLLGMNLWMIIENCNNKYKDGI